MGIVIIIMLGILIFIGIRIKKILMDIRHYIFLQREELRIAFRTLLSNFVGDDHED